MVLSFAAPERCRRRQKRQMNVSITARVTLRLLSEFFLLHSRAYISSQLSHWFV